MQIKLTTDQKAEVLAAYITDSTLIAELHDALFVLDADSDVPSVLQAAIAKLNEGDNNVK